MFKELYNVLPAYGQVLLTFMIVGMGGFATWYGLVENFRKKAIAPEQQPGSIPLWLLMGPAHEAIQSIHEISRHAESQTAVLRDIDKSLDRIDRGQDYTHRLLEAVLRDQALAVPPPSRERRR